MDAHYLVLGQGISGTLISWRLLESGAQVTMLDANDPTAASRVAPGVINPLAGKRLKPCWHIEAQLPEALTLYRSMEEALGQTCFHEVPIIRVIKDARQQADFATRMASEDARPYIGEVYEAGALGPKLHDPFGSFVAEGSGWLDVAALCGRLRQQWLDEGRLQTGHMNWEALKPYGMQVVYQDCRYNGVIFCEGWLGHNNPFFPEVRWKPARGELLELELLSEPFLPEALTGSILNCRSWLLPLGNGRYRAGATYAWEAFTDGPTQEKREAILHSLRRYVDAAFRVTAQRVGVRPVVEDYRPVIGRHREHPGLILFNGFGSKGVLIAPWASRLLLAHLQHDAPLPSEFDPYRFKGD